MWRILIENSSVSVILHSIFVVFLPDLLSSRLYFLPQTWPAQCDCELKSSGILYTHLYSIYCSTKIYDFSSQFPSEAAWPFWRQREKPICPGSPQSPDVKSSSSVQRASSFVSSRKLEILWRILPSRKTQDFFSALRVFPDCVSKGKGKGWAQTNQTRTQLNKTTTFRSNAPPTQNKTKQGKTKCRDNGVSGRKPQKLILQRAVSPPEALRCSGSDPDGTHTDAGSRPGDPSALTPNGFSVPSSPSFPGEADPKVATSAWTLALQPSWLVAELIQKGTIIPQSATQTSRDF